MVKEAKRYYSALGAKKALQYSRSQKGTTVLKEPKRYYKTRSAQPRLPHQKPKVTTQHGVPRVKTVCPFKPQQQC